MTRTLDPTTDDIDPAETLLRATFAAAAGQVVVTPRPTLVDTEPAIVMPIGPLRRRPVRWAAAAAVIVLLGGAAWQLGGRNDGVDVATVPTSIDPVDSPFAPFAEPTWLPDGVIPIIASQDDRPPAYTADIVTATDEHATIHWTYAPDEPDPRWNDGRDPANPNDADNTVSIGGADNDGFHAWGEPSHALYSIDAGTPRTPPKAATFDTISVLLEDLHRQCRPDYTCQHFEIIDVVGVLDGARVVRQGPDETNLGQNRIFYASERGAPSITATTWTTTGVIPDGAQPVPVVGLYPPPVDEPGFESEPMTVDDHPALFMAGPDHSMVIVEYPERGVSVAIQSTRSSHGDDSTTDPADRSTLLRIALSIQIRPGSDFVTTARRYFNGVSGAHLTTLDTGSLQFDAAEFTGPNADEGCPVIAIARRIGFGSNSFGGDTCSRRSAGDLDPVQVSGVDTHDGHRMWLGTFDDSVVTLRIRMATGEIIERPTVEVPDRPIRLVAVDLPAGAGTVQLLDADGAPVASTSPTSFKADDTMTFG